MERLCQFCNTPLAPNKRSHAIFCSIPCKKSAEHKRRIQDPEKKEKNRIRSKLWREQNPERAKRNVSLWQKENRARCSSIGRRYLARKLKAIPSWLTGDQMFEIDQVYVQRDYVTQETGVVHEVDHIVPLQGKTVCGLHVPWNLQVITKEANVAKRHFTWPNMWDEETTILSEVD